MNNMLSNITRVLLKGWCWRGAPYSRRSHFKGYMAEHWSCHPRSILASRTSGLSAPSSVITASALQPENESFSPTHNGSLCFSLLTPCTLGDLSCCDLSRKFPHGQAPAHVWFSIVTPLDWRVIM